MKFSKQITVNASADKVWDVLGHDFANIGTWSTAVSNSVANNELAKVNNSPVGGRVCKTSFGDISEEFTAYDETGKTFSFKGVIKSKMFTSLTNTIKVSSTGENSTLVEIIPEVKLTFLGKLMYPMIKMQLNSTLDQLFKDLKYYVEKGSPSPSKLASQKK